MFYFLQSNALRYRALSAYLLSPPEPPKRWAQAMLSTLFEKDFNNQPEETSLLTCCSNIKELIISCNKNFAPKWFLSWKPRLSRKVKPNSLLSPCFSSLPPQHLASKRHKGMPLDHFWQNHIWDVKICWNFVTLWVPWARWDEPLVYLWPFLLCHRPPPSQPSVATSNHHPYYSNALHKDADWQYLRVLL